MNEKDKSTNYIGILYNRLFYIIVYFRGNSINEKRKVSQRPQNAQ